MVTKEGEYGKALLCRKLITTFVRAFRRYGRQTGRYCCIARELTLGMGPFCRFLATEESDKTSQDSLAQNIFSIFFGPLNNIDKSYYS